MHWIDPASLPEKKGKVTQFLVNPHGDLDGLVLGRSTLVHFPPHLSRQVARHISVGSTVRVRGVKPRGADVLAAVSLTSQDNVVITDDGPDAATHGIHSVERARKHGEATGRVTLSLFGPKGELRGALLESGTSLRMPPHAASELADYLTPGACIHAWGSVVKTRHGTTLDVESIAFGDEQDE
ncbi:hypothetical protein [Noviherbaspirillum pedocola]|uniref:hypothetical protein n=1 Tax=Noviherbaspirillum pedocola TaxID=2801341 RepID=UPI001F39D777|nr:hypothetical protein [Noviherbaspirillum pedocola]